MSIRSLGLIIAVSLIFALGLLMVFNTSAAELIDRDLGASTHRALVRQLLYLAVGLAAGFVVYRAGYQMLLKLSVPLLLLTSLLLLLVFVPGIGLQVNGSHRWIRLLGLTVQPSELAKLTVPLYAIHVVLSGRSLLKGMAVAMVPIGLIFLEPDNGSVAIIGLTCLCVCYVTGVKARYWLLPLLGMMVVAVIAATQLDYVSSRLNVYLHPELDLLGRGHQPYQAKIAAGSGGLVGRGIGQSLQKFTYLPEAQNDYIAAIYAEEFGFLGVLGLLLLYMVASLLTFLIAKRSRSVEGFCLIATLGFLFAIQAFLNLGVVSGLMPTTGINLPFFSQGGSSLIANICNFALILQVDAKTRTDSNRWNRRTPFSGRKVGL